MELHNLTPLHINLIYLFADKAKLNSLRFAGNARRRNLGRLAYCESKPRQVWSTMSRARNKHGHWEVWYLVSNRPLRAKRMAAE
jgi:hypothetical protein